MKSVRFVPVDRATAYLLPPWLDEWLPEDHLARFVVDVVDQLDLHELASQYSGRGSAAYHPGMLIALLFYGYATGVFSSRRLEQATYDSLAMRYIAANTHPDHDTIATFRRRFLPKLQGLFLQILVLASEMDLVKLGTVSLDGTKVKANASKHSALSWDHACKLEQQLQQEVEALLVQAEKCDQAEEHVDIPEELTRRETRLATIAKAKARIEARANERYAREQAEYDRKMQSRETKQRVTGKKPGGRSPKPPEAGPQPQDQVNLTDSESRIMPTSGGGFEQCYNAQASVDMDSLLIVGQHVTQAPNDKRELEPALAELDKIPEELGRIETMAADNGYYSETNLKAAEDRDIVPLIAMGRERHNVPLDQRQRPADLPAEPESIVERLAHRLQSEKGKALYARRKCTVEPVFGVIKAVMGFRQFLLRGKDKVSGEWTLVSIAWNLKRMAKLQAMRA
jgi:transposase